MRSRTRPYRIWLNIKSRCNWESGDCYQNYGGRGITYDPKWETFDGFWEDMKDGYEKNLTIDRVDNNGNYTKENCRWATKKEQSNNKRNNILITMDGKTQNLTQWCEELGLKRATIYSRIYLLNWKPEEAIKGKNRGKNIISNNPKKMAVRIHSCNRCGHEWAGRKVEVPKKCPACKNDYWNKERVFDPVTKKRILERSKHGTRTRNTTAN